MIAALAGGVGAAKLLLGLARVSDPETLTIIVNTGDDFELHGLLISPDLDIVTYTLAGVVEERTGWGIRGDSFAALEILERYGRETWFHLGDRDLATHLHRTALRRSGVPLSQATDAIRKAWGVKARILPMSDEPVPTMIRTEQGYIHVQEYLVRDRAGPKVRGILFQGVEAAKPAPGVLEALREAQGIVICPSNPLISIGPILAIPGIREALKEAKGPVVAVSPVVGGVSLKGPTDKMLTDLGFEASPVQIARLYQDFLDLLIIDHQDATSRGAIEAFGIKTSVTNTVMKSLEDKIRLAGEVLALFARV